MTHPSKRKGDHAELEVQAILRDLLGVPARRALGAGRKDDQGDITGVPDTVIQVANWPADTLGAIRHKPIEAEAQRLRAGATFAATFVRLRGRVWRVVLTPEQWSTFWREAVPPPAVPDGCPGLEPWNRPTSADLAEQETLDDASE